MLPYSLAPPRESWRNSVSVAFSLDGLALSFGSFPQSTSGGTEACTKGGPHLLHLKATFVDMQCHAET